MLQVFAEDYKWNQGFGPYGIRPQTLRAADPKLCFIWFGFSAPILPVLFKNVCSHVFSLPYVNVPQKAKRRKLVLVHTGRS